ncbi:MAG TPA: histidinol dehydrogenase [Syntrophaceae bacterium]|jgi:histidinol dehydrogenase|nr:histidinol dehydrogenase [Syntrophaceae bacterium]
MRILSTDEAAFEDTFSQIRNRGKIFDQKIWETVKNIVDDVAARGDEALFAHTKALDGYQLTTRNAAVSPEEIEDAILRIPPQDYAILKLAAERIEKFHRKQHLEDWFYTDEDGTELGQRVLPLERVGIYTPGGLASYPSTVIMASVPAQIAGVREIILVTPSKDAKVNPLIAAAAKLCGITKVFKIGGAQAIAALAYGTETIPKVDKIVGPGNAYVTAAKKMVYGQVAIDMLAGPSEVLIIADTTADASFIAADMLSQAEHDEMASAICVTPDKNLAKEVASEMETQLAGLKRNAIAACALKDFGAIIVTKDMDEAVSVVDRFAPEHLELMVGNPRELLAKIKHAGAVFLGNNTPEAIGDYIAGPNHILPTGGTARFSSPLGVYDFVKRSSVLFFSSESLRKYGKQAARFAEMEGLEAHCRSIEKRLSRKKS